MHVADVLGGLLVDLLVGLDVHLGSRPDITSVHLSSFPMVSLIS